MRRAFLALAILVAVAHPQAAAAQQANVCRLVNQQGPWTAVGPPEARTVSASGPLLVRCDRGEELRADSAVLYQAMNEVHLFGRVDYQDPARSLTSNYATYNGATGRLYATGSVVFTDKTRGSTLRGPELEYFRAMQGRPDAQAIAVGRPHLTIAPKPGSRQKDPMEIDADRITTVGENYVTASGRVVIDGKEMDATADEAYYDAALERMELRRNARATGEGYALSGDFIEAEMDQGAIRRVVAREQARLVHEKMDLRGPQLQLFFANELLQRMVSSRAPGAADTARSIALARGFVMEADSLEALTPGQELERVIAIGSARGEAWDTTRVAPPVLDDRGRLAGAPFSSAAPAAADSASDAPRVASALGERDQIFADTIVGFFRRDTAVAAAPVAAGDAPRGEEQEAELERMLATGSARALYRMRDEKRPDQKPGISYVIGDQIDLAFSTGEVDVVKVRGLKKGVYLDPKPAENAPGTGTDAATPQALGSAGTGSAQEARGGVR